MGKGHKTVNPPAIEFSPTVCIKLQSSGAQYLQSVKMTGKDKVELTFIENPPKAATSGCR